jgi:hypothetical protein
VTDPNILLAVPDSDRARNVGLYGDDHDTGPFLSDLVNEATKRRLHDLGYAD